MLNQTFQKLNKIVETEISTSTNALQNSKYAGIQIIPVNLIKHITVST